MLTKNQKKGARHDETEMKKTQKTEQSMRH